MGESKVNITLSADDGMASCQRRSCRNAGQLYAALLHDSARDDASSRFIAGGHFTIFSDWGLPSSVIRLRTLRAINASVCCASRCWARRRSPMMRLYRYIAFSAAACWWAPDSLRHCRLPTSPILSMAWLR